MEILLSTLSGTPIQEVLIDLPGLLTVPAEDMRLAGEMARSAILERTAKGVSVSGVAFAPYNETTPYYYNPSRQRAAKQTGRFGTPLRRFTAKQEKASAGRLLSKLRKAGDSTAVRGLSGGTIKFPSYAAFKRAFGRANVDLRGVAAPNMLDAIVVTAEANEASVAIGGVSGRIARGHTTGNRPKGMPLRQFFGLSTDDRDNIRAVLLQKLVERIRAK